MTPNDDGDLPVIMTAETPDELKERLLRAFKALLKQKHVTHEEGVYQRQRETLARERPEPNAKVAAIRRLSGALDDRERAVEARELEADAGFQTRRAAAMQALEEALVARRVQAEQQMANDREAFDAALQAQRETIATEAASLASRISELDKRQEMLDKERFELGRERVSVEHRERQIDEEVKVKATTTVQRLEVDLHIARTEAQAAMDTVNQLAEELSQLRTKWAAAGVDDPRRLLDKLSSAQKQNRELQDRLAAQLDDDSLDRLRALEQQNRELNAERERLEYELQEERGRQLADRINNLQVKQLADAQQQFDVIKRGYDMRIAELRGTLSELVDGRADPTDPLFPNCIALDDDPQLQEVGHLVDDTEEKLDLKELARALQGRMQRESERAYSLDDVCGVLGGMAMSRLHLLEGRSGIGKTSLPMALAAALGTECTIIEVQAGWRDRYDLFGHYNTFERRFQEEPFLLALYKARTPRYCGRPFFIVLDEMNLARPEQYFSVLLSRLESRDPEPIKLAPVSTGPKPACMDETGTGIRLPENVWFVGTANQDESTLEFADKTYNRSYVLELPARPPSVPSHGEVEPYSVGALLRAFERAQDAHLSKVKDVKDLLQDLAGDLYEIGRIQVDPRLESQLDAYVPVVVAARGTNTVNESDAVSTSMPGGEGTFDPVALAADQFIASKVLHQLRSRFEVTVDGIKQLEESLNLYWPERFDRTDPIRCRKVLSDQQRRRTA
jgi:hypothetical protein